MKIKVSYGYTFNKGNYESERIDVSIEHTASADNYVDALEQAHSIVKKFVWKKGGKL